eukprot:TRINITY_DN7093_c0_g1_i2.p1 TRINITY_DN7093_c0_g1~~TRINITY_DN7093_c0_g1_i2.p1  ORF type:complete len:173 (-),score=55.36 TRINITY_DN7093_c0_g1_i2:131-649(-)
MCVFFFKQKTAYEMQRGLVGSEMCIRDSINAEYMGRSGIPYFREKIEFGNKESLMVNNGFRIPEPLNPRATTAKMYYSERKKPFHLPAPVEKKRVQMLEDPVWNEKRFTGEDVQRITWFNQNVIEVDPEGPHHGRGSSPKAEKIHRYTDMLRKGDKQEKHEKALQELSLIHI